jgi:hypothetical protein
MDGPRWVSKRQQGCEMAVWIYVDTSKQVGDPDHLKVFASQEAAQAWFEENDPEGVAFEYEVLEWKMPPTYGAINAPAAMITSPMRIIATSIVSQLKNYEHSDPSFPVVALCRVGRLLFW